MIKMICAVAMFVVFIIIVFYFSNRRRYIDVYVYVAKYEDGYRVRGSDIDVTEMMIECVRSLEERGYNVTQIKKAILNAMGKS